MDALAALNVVFKEKVKSQKDKTIKYIFLWNGQVVEFSYIDKGDDKDIICAPTQTACKLKCKFCFLSDYDLEVRNITAEVICACVDYVVADLNLLVRADKKNVFLVSFMGCGEPLCNISHVIASCKNILCTYRDKYETVRFAVASLIPSHHAMRTFITEVYENKLPVKFHLSLHFTDERQREEWMPAASPILASITWVQVFCAATKNSAEIHYSLMEGINDRAMDIIALSYLLSPYRLQYPIPVKILAYNEKPTLADCHRSQNVARFREALEEEGIATEFYDPPGSDIGSSCGQFLMEYYEKYNAIKKKKE